jgi:hypothetical protein
MGGVRLMIVFLSLLVRVIEMCLFYDDDDEMILSGEERGIKDVGDLRTKKSNRLTRNRNVLH